MFQSDNNLLVMLVAESTGGKLGGAASFLAYKARTLTGSLLVTGVK